MKWYHWTLEVCYVAAALLFGVSVGASTSGPLRETGLQIGAGLGSMAALGVFGFALGIKRAEKHSR